MLEIKTTHRKMPELLWVAMGEWYMWQVETRPDIAEELAKEYPNQFAKVEPQLVEELRVAEITMRNIQRKINKYLEEKCLT